MPRILVTGGAGYIGSVLVPLLLQNGHAVTVVDNFMYRQTSLNHVCDQKRFSVVRGDCRDMRLMKPLLKQTDFFIPLAAIVGAPACDKDAAAAITTNYESIRDTVSELSKQQGVLVPITNSGYGIGGQGECTEVSPLKPLTLYGRTKVNAEGAVLAHGNAISFRLATVFGMSPRMRLDLLVNDFVYRALTDRAVVLFEAHFRRNYIHVLDVARVFWHGLRDFSKLAGKAYNVGLSDANLTKLQLCEKIKEHLPQFMFLESPIGEDPDKRDYIVSNARIEATGWKPTRTLDDGIEELIKGLSMFRGSVYSNV